MKEDYADHISNEIRQILEEKLTAYNQGRPLGQGAYIVRMPQGSSLYYTLWRHEPTAVYHPYVYLNDLELNVLGSVESAMRTLNNSFLPLEVREILDLPPGNGDDIILFGKYRGYHLWDIYRIDPRYVQWIAEKFTPQVKGEFRFKELAETYNKVYLDLQTRKHYKSSTSGYAGSVGDKLSNLQLRILRVRMEDDPYRTKVVAGEVHYYVDQLVTAVDASDNHFFIVFKARDRSLDSQVLAAGSHPYNAGDILSIASAKVLKQFVSRNIRYTKLGYLKF